MNSVDLAEDVVPMINITKSEFINLNWGHAVQYLSLLGAGNLPMTGSPEIEYEPFDNHGSIANLQGF